MTADTFHDIAISTLHSEKRPRLSRLLREPLLHFIVLGAVLFGLNAVIAPAVPAEKMIELTSDTKKSIVDAFTNARGRAPTPGELKSQIDDWLLDEITYREALAQGFDKGDDMIRARLMQKMRLLIFSNVTVAEPSRAQLQEWLDTHRARYNVPKRVSFFELPIGASQASAEATLKEINAGKEPEAVRLRARTFADRPIESLVGGFSKQFIDELLALPMRKWQMLQSTDGWHIVRLDAIVPERQVDVDEVRDPLAEDWKQEQARTRAVSTVRTMGKSYVIGGLDRP